MKTRVSLQAQITILLLVLVFSIISLVSLFHFWFEDIILAAIISSSIIVPTSIITLHAYMSSINKVLSALNAGFHSFFDNDFSISLAKTRNDELGDLIDIYNKVGETLRDERLHLYQRELLLDTVIQTTPLSLILTDNSGAIIYSNSAARKLFLDGKQVNGTKFETLLAGKPEAFRRSVASGLSGLFTVSENENNETYHLTQNQFLLNGKKHKLYLFKSLTKEINRQEVNTWKKVIRLISHELNNSLAPITSLAHSGQTLCERQNDTKLSHVFSTMGERAKHLQTFIEGYAKFSRLPKPQIQRIDTSNFILGLQQIQDFRLNCNKNSLPIYCDPAQMQQVLINLIKNSHEACKENPEVLLSISVQKDRFDIEIEDNGKGMSEANLANALLPFYSTKSEGTGLGLPLCREIIEAHGGKLMINNRPQGGLKVTLQMPNLIQD